MTKKEEQIIKDNTVDIRGNEYLTVAGRLQLMHQDVKDNDWAYKIETKVLSHNPVVVKAHLVITNEKTKHVVKDATGISAANPAKPIEKMSPYEVAETSAVGRALGFAGYGLIDQVASADEIHKASQSNLADHGLTKKDADDINDVLAEAERKCAKCGQPAVLKEGMSQKTGKYWKAYFCSTGEKSHAEFLS